MTKLATSWRDAKCRARSDKSPHAWRATTQSTVTLSDDASYVSDETRAYWEARDPIQLYVSYLLGKGGMRQDVLDKIDLECTVIVDEAVRWADSMPFPKPESVTERLFAPRSR